jgi:hypothetical protein
MLSHFHHRMLCLFTIFNSQYFRKLKVLYTSLHYYCSYYKYSKSPNPVSLQSSRNVSHITQNLKYLIMHMIWSNEIVECSTYSQTVISSWLRHIIGNWWRNGDQLHDTLKGPKFNLQEFPIHTLFAVLHVLVHVSWRFQWLNKLLDELYIVRSSADENHGDCYRGRLSRLLRSLQVKGVVRLAQILTR